MSRWSAQWTRGSAHKIWASARLCLLTVTLAAVAVAARPVLVRPSVKVAAEVVAHGDRITLGELAEVAAGDPEEAARLKRISLGYAPGVGLMRELTRAQIAMALAAAGFGEADVRLDAPDVVIIKRASQQVDLTLVRDAVERATLVDLRANGATARLVRLDLPPVIEVPAGKVEARASMANVRDLYAPFLVFIELWMEGRIVHRLSATAQVEAHAPVLVAARQLAANTRLRPDAVTTEVRRLNRPLSAYVLDPGRLRGMAVREAVARGEVITTDLMLAEYVVKPGDQVRVIGESSGVPTKVQIIVSGEARTAGRVGDRVQVKNLQSGNLLQAVVVDEGLVRVKF